MQSSDTDKLTNLEGNIKITIPELETKRLKLGFSNPTIVVSVISGILLFTIGLAIFFIAFFRLKYIDLTAVILCMFLILSLSVIALCLIIYKVESKIIAYEIEEAKSSSALKRKLLEDAIIRDIKLQENSANKLIKKE